MVCFSASTLALLECLTSSSMICGALANVSGVSTSKSKETFCVPLFGLQYCHAVPKASSYSCCSHNLMACNYQCVKYALKLQDRPLLYGQNAMLEEAYLQTATQSLKACEKAGITAWSMHLLCMPCCTCTQASRLWTRSLTRSSGPELNLFHFPSEVITHCKQSPHLKPLNALVPHLFQIA